MSASNQNKVTRQARVSQVIAGIEKYFSTLPSINLGGTSFTPAALVDKLQKVLDVIKQTSSARDAWLAEVQTERNAIAELGPVLRYIKAFVVAQFGDTQDSGQKLGDFGFTPRKVPTRTVAVKAEAAAKVVATRAARSTMGKKQKAKIKGAVAPQPAKAGSGTAAPATPAGSSTPAPVKPAS